jgi:putative SOS response-associated peptidase YedK
MTQQRPTSELADIFEAEDLVGEPGGHFNLAPTDPAAVVVQRDDRRALTAYRWGLIPHWSDGPRAGSKMFNARAETIDRTPAFRYAFEKRRCLVPVDSFYEWRREGGTRQPYAIVRRDGRPLALAGLWAGWKDEDTGEVIRSFTVVTTQANDVVRPIHDRMPVVLPESAWDLWLDPTATDAPALAELKGLLVPADDAALEAYRVSRRVNDVRNDDPGLVAPLDPSEAEPAEAPEPKGRRASKRKAAGDAGSEVDQLTLPGVDPAER